MESERRVTSIDAYDGAQSRFAEDRKVFIYSVKLFFSELKLKMEV